MAALTCMMTRFFVTNLPPAEATVDMTWNICGGNAPNCNQYSTTVAQKAFENAIYNSTEEWGTQETCADQQIHMQNAWLFAGYHGSAFGISKVTNSGCRLHGNTIFTKAQPNDYPFKPYPGSVDPSGDQRNYICARIDASARMSCSTHLSNNNIPKASDQANVFRSDLDTAYAYGFRSHGMGDLNMHPDQGGQGLRWIAYKEADGANGSSTTDSSGKLDYNFFRSEAYAVYPPATIVNESLSDHHSFFASFK